MDSSTTVGQQQDQEQTPVLRLLAASQPDIVRSVQKDDLYQQQLLDTFQDVLRNYLGPLPALQYARESKLVALLLYHGLTTGQGITTLGEEYCNLMQVTGSGVGPALSRRTLLVLLKSVGPYLAETLVARLDRQQQGTSWQDGDETQGDPSPSSKDSELDGPHDQGSYLSGSGQQGTGHAQSAAYSDRGLAGSVTGGGGVLQPSKVASLFHWMPSLWRLAKVRLAHAWPQLRPAATQLARLHLALFYLAGVYFTIPHRLAGIRYIATTRPLQGSTSYRALGLVLVLQLAVSAAMQAHSSLTTIAEKRAAGSSATSSGSAVEGSARWKAWQGQIANTHQHAVLLEEETEGVQDGKEDAAKGWVGDKSELGSGNAVVIGRQGYPQEGEVPSVEPVVCSAQDRSCPLCLSPRRWPASTPCGHVFCWECVAAWCNEKPECPLCRARVLLPQLVPVYHCNQF